MAAYTSATLSLIQSFIYGSETSFAGASQSINQLENASDQMCNIVEGEKSKVESDEDGAETESKMAENLKVSNYCNVKQNIHSNTVTLSEQIFDATHTYLKESLKYWKFESKQHGYIYKSKQGQKFKVTDNMAINTKHASPRS